MFNQRSRHKTFFDLRRNSRVLEANRNRLHCATLGLTEQKYNKIDISQNVIERWLLKAKKSDVAVEFLHKLRSSYT